MSYIEILILRRLRSGPAHGYELRKRVEQTTGVAYRAAIRPMPNDPAIR